MAPSSQPTIKPMVRTAATRKWSKRMKPPSNGTFAPPTTQRGDQSEADRPNPPRSLQYNRLPATRMIGADRFDCNETLQLQRNVAQSSYILACWERGWKPDTTVSSLRCGAHST